MLTKDKQPKTRLLATVGHPLAAAAMVFKGALMALNAQGFAQPATREADLTITGFALKGVDNSTGQDGERICEVRQDEAILVKNDAVNPVTRLHIGKPCYVVDDETVTSLADGSSIAGTVQDITDSGVWITF